MKKRNGFISTAVVYSFFFVFMMMLLFIIERYYDNRTILKSVKTDVKEEVDKDTKDFIDNDYEDPVGSGEKFSDYIKTYVYKGQGINGLYHHNGSIKLNIMIGLNEESKIVDANDYSYRYAGKNPNNYVCFGSNESPCPYDNLYRIIGVFGDQVKLIMADYPGPNQIGSVSEAQYPESNYIGNKDKLYPINFRYNWFDDEEDGPLGPDLESSNLIFNHDYYLNTHLGSWADKIATANWRLSQIGLSSSWHPTWVNTYEPCLSHNQKKDRCWCCERDNRGHCVRMCDSYKGGYYNYYRAYDVYKQETEYSYFANMKIGLLSLSDYLYAVPSNYWDTVVYDPGSSKEIDYSWKKNNWLYLGVEKEYLINHSYPNSWHGYRYVWYIENGALDNTSTSYSEADQFFARPAFYLNSDVTYRLGKGTIESPYRID